MRQPKHIGMTCIWAGAALLLATGIASLRAQGPEGARTANALFTSLDSDNDGTLTRSELEAGFIWGWNQRSAACAIHGQARTSQHLQPGR
jgi:hypothetical protein